MTQEEKQLLLRDICARLPYGVKIKVRSNDTRTVRAVDVVEGIVHFVEPDSISPYGVHIEHPTTFHQVVKPYLRPMSSMTEEEIDELNSISHEFGFEWLDAKTTEERYAASAKMQSRSTDFYNAHHFDYRGLIPMGLALEAPEGMYKIE